MFTGGSQFAFIGVIGAGGAAAAAAAIASAGLLGVRNVAYGLRMAPVVGTTPMRRVLAPHFTIDESTAVALAHAEPQARSLGFWVTGVGIYVGWNLTTLLGALLGDVLGDPRAYGLDAAAGPAAFLALLWPRLRRRQAIAVGGRGRGRGDRAHAHADAGDPGPRGGARGRRGRVDERVRSAARSHAAGRRAGSRGDAATLWTAVALASVVCVALKALGCASPALVRRARPVADHRPVDGRAAGSPRRRRRRSAWVSRSWWMPVCRPCWRPRDCSNAGALPGGGHGGGPGRGAAAAVGPGRLRPDGRTGAEA